MGFILIFEVFIDTTTVTIAFTWVATNIKAGYLLAMLILHTKKFRTGKGAPEVLGQVIILTKQYKAVGPATSPRAQK